MALVNLSLDCGTLVLEGCQLLLERDGREFRILPLLFLAFEVWNEVSDTGFPVSGYRTACLQLDLFLLACICLSPSLHVESFLRISSSLRSGICVVLKWRLSLCSWIQPVPWGNCVWSLQKYWCVNQSLDFALVKVVRDQCEINERWPWMVEGEEHVSTRKLRLHPPPMTTCLL